MYKSGIYIVDPIGNNEFHYNERIALWSEGKIFVPNLIQWSLAELEEWSEIVFEEVEPTKSRNGGMNNNTLVSCTGLKHFIQTSYKGIPTYIFDNHNHALFFRYWHTAQLKAPLIKGKKSVDADGGFKPFKVIHIDQHADTKPNNAELKVQNLEWIEDFINTKTNVGNFISAALHNNIINEVIQVRSEHTLHNMEPLDFQNYNYILDIDVDFWACLPGQEWKSEQEIKSDFEIIRKIVDNVCLITIATSPYFMNQKKAIDLIKKLLS